MNLRPSGYEPDELPTAPPRVIWCRRPESNRYDVLASQDFKSCASASSATSAYLFYYKLRITSSTTSFISLTYKVLFAHSLLVSSYYSLLANTFFVLLLTSHYCFVLVLLFFRTFDILPQTIFFCNSFIVMVAEIGLEPTTLRV